MVALYIQQVIIDGYIHNLRSAACRTKKAKQCKKNTRGYVYDFPLSPKTQPTALFFSNNNQIKGILDQPLQTKSKKAEAMDKVS